MSVKSMSFKNAAESLSKLYEKVQLKLPLWSKSYLWFACQRSSLICCEFANMITAFGTNPKSKFSAVTLISSFYCLNGCAVPTRGKEVGYFHKTNWLQQGFAVFQSKDMWNLHDLKQAWTAHAWNKCLRQAGLYRMLSQCFVLEASTISGDLPLWS